MLPTPLPPTPTTPDHALEQAQQRNAELFQTLARTTSAAEAATQQIALLLDLLPEGVALFSADGHIQAINQRFLTLYSLPDVPADWLGRAGCDLLAHVQTQVVEPVECLAPSSARHQSYASGSSDSKVVGLRDGRVLACDVVQAPTDGDHSGQLLLCLRDVTERQQLVAEVASIASIPEQNPHPVLRIAASGQQVYANAAAQQLAQNAVVQLSMQRDLRAVAEQALARGEAHHREIELGDRYFSVHVVPFAQEGYVNLYLIDITARVLAERRLQEQQHFYESILNELPAEVFVVDQEYRYLFVNPTAVPDAALRQWMIGRTNAEYNLRRGHPATVAQLRQAHLKTVLETCRRHEWIETLGEGEQRQDMLRRLQPVPEGSESVHLVIGYGLDITAGEAARRELREQEEFTRRILDASPSAIYVRDAQQRLLFANKAMMALRKVSRHLSGEAIPPDSMEAQELAQLAANDQQVLGTGRELIVEEALTQRDGTARMFQTVRRPLPLPDNSVCILGVSTDITAFKQTQQTLERSEKQYRDLMIYTQAHIFTHALDGTVLTANPALSELLHRPMHDLVGSNIMEAMIPEDHAAAAVYLERIAIEHAASGVQRVRPHGSAELRYLLYRNYLVAESGQMPYVIAHSHDITERIAAERAMKRAKDAAESAARAKENFLANMSHEIRTPLNGVLGMAGQLSKTRLDPRQQEFLHVIRTSGQHLLSVINDVLDMAKISSGKLEFERVAFNLCDSINQSLQPLMLQAQEKGLEFHATLLSSSCPYPWVVGDPYRLNQILLNLVANAIKFTKQGSITVVGRQVEATATHLTIEFSVTDTGIGIAADQQARIFEDFAQAYADTTRQFGGTGLGLSISRALVDQLGGTLTLYSEPGHGSVFSFSITLPTAEPPVNTSPSSAKSNTGAFAGVRVLLVEDNEINRELARLMLEEWGVVLEEAVDGDQGLQMLTDHVYDVVLMDIQMPGLNGIEVTQAVRQLPDPIRSQVPILALTANAFREDNERYRAAGMNDCLAKPYEEADLYHKLESLLAAPRATAPYDLTKLRAMAHGRDAFVSKIIRSFLANTPATLHRLQAASTAGEWGEVAELAHYIKPNLVALGVNGASAIVALLEKLPAADQSTAERPSLVAHLVALVNQVLTALPAELPKEGLGKRY